MPNHPFKNMTNELRDEFIALNKLRYEAIAALNDPLCGMTKEQFVAKYLQTYDLTIDDKETEDKDNGRHRQPSSSVRSNPAKQSGIAGPAGALGYSYITLTAFDYAERTVEEAGIRAGEVIAYRAWWTLGDRLFSVYMSDYEWFPGESLDGNPQIHNSIGVHAFKDAKSLRDYCEGVKVWYDGSDLKYIPDVIRMGGRLVTGMVALWGDIIEHERGYRAQHAKPIHIDADKTHASSYLEISRLRTRYGVPHVG